MSDFTCTVLLPQLAQKSSVSVQHLLPASSPQHPQSCRQPSAVLPLCAQWPSSRRCRSPRPRCDGGLLLSLLGCKDRGSSRISGASSPIGSIVRESHNSTISGILLRSAWPLLWVHMPSSRSRTCLIRGGKRSSSSSKEAIAGQARCTSDLRTYHV